MWPDRRIIDLFTTLGPLKAASEKLGKVDFTSLLAGHWRVPRWRD
jgi:hypothetical protein